MEIKTKNETEAATVEVIDPSTGDCIGSVTIPVGSEVVVTAVNAHEAGDIQIGEVHETTVAEEAEESNETDGTSAADGAEPDPSC